MNARNPAADFSEMPQSEKDAYSEFREMVVRFMAKSDERQSAHERECRLVREESKKDWEQARGLLGRIERSNQDIILGIRETQDADRRATNDRLVETNRRINQVDDNTHKSIRNIYLQGWALAGIIISAMAFITWELMSFIVEHATRIFR